MNFYKNGENYIGWHSDDENDLCKNTPIFSVSLGATRDFQLRHKVTGQTFEQPLRNNSLVIMYPPCQDIYKHQLPKRKKVKESRLNLTFRVVNMKKDQHSFMFHQMKNYLNSEMINLILYYLE